MYRNWKKAVASVALASIALSGLQAETKVDPKIPAYKKTSGVSGNLNSIGSDTLNNLMTFWVEGFRKAYPNVNIQVEGKGSSTAPPALIEGTAQLGPMSRKMKDKEEEEFEKKYGFRPTKVGVALDSLAVYVHKDNPIAQLTMVEVDGVFSSTNKCGSKAITKWGEVGLKGKFAAMPMSLYGRNSASGTYGYFKEHALCKGDFQNTVKEQPGSASVVQGVEKDLGGIGYSGIGYKTSGVKAVALSDDGKKYYEANYENVLDGKYPLGRMLFIYVSKAPGKPMDKLTQEFLKYTLSKEGQEVVIKDGYLPLTAKLAAVQLKVLE